MRVVQVNPEALVKLAKVTKKKVAGPYKPPSHQYQPYYYMVIQGKDLHRLMHQLWPYLTNRMRRKYVTLYKERTNSLPSE